MLEVIKIQGDPNVPRGEYSFVFPDISSINRRCTEVEFEGSNTTCGYGQVAGTFFRGPTWIPVEGILPKIYSHGQGSSFHTMKSLLLGPDSGTSATTSE
jgi:hypothetical protein